MNANAIDRVSDLERAYVEEVLRAGFRTSEGGGMTTRLEVAFANAYGTDFAVAFVNGTTTLHAGLLAAGVGPGDEVIVPPLTMSSTTLSVLHAGAVPVFADVDPDTFQVDPSAIEGLCNERTKAIMPVALYGLAPDMDAIMELANQRDLIVIEDAAEAVGAYCGEVPVGAIGHMGSFSFQSSKHLTSGEGGMVITSNEQFANNLRRIGSLGYAGVGPSEGKIDRFALQDPNYARHVSVGFNFRMPDLCAAVALAQVERREELVGRRIEVAELFGSVAQGHNWIVPQVTPPGYTNSYWTWVCKLSPDRSWHQFRDTFRSFGGDGIYGAWKLAYKEPIFEDGFPQPDPCYQGSYQQYANGLCPVAEALQPLLLQFKTNYWDWERAEEQAEALAKTIDFLS